MSPIKGEGDVLFLVQIASVLARCFLVCNISHELVDELERNLHGNNIGA